MNITALLEQLLQSGRQLASKGQTIAEDKLNVPQQGESRDAMLSGLGKGALAGGVLALLLGTKSGRKVGGNLAKVGGLAALGGVAYTAYKNWQANQPDAPVEPGTPVGQLTGPAADQRSLQLLKAMIAAAKADGHIDDAERAKIHQQVQQLGLDDSAVALLNAELDKPLDAKDIAAGTDSAEAAAEIYLASLLVIEVDNSMERAYLNALAQELQLADELTQQMEAEIA